MVKRNELKEIGRCPWAKTELYVEYHDKEWGVPVHEDRLLFEFLILEGAQAGLSWETILKKREKYRAGLRPVRSRRRRQGTARESSRACWPIPGSSATG